MALATQPHIQTTQPKPWLAPLVVVIALAALFLPGLVEHIRLSADPLIFNDDVRQHVFAFYPFYQLGLFDQDYLAQYILSLSPPGHSLIYILCAQAFDPAWVSKVLPHVQHALVLIVLGLCAHRLGGWVAVFSTLALVLSSDVFLFRMTGGVARSWGFLIIACGAASLIFGRVYLLAVVCVVGAVLYPPAAAVCGLSLAIWLLLWPASIRGKAASWRLLKRIGLVAGVALVCAGLLYPMVAGLSQYGRRLGPADVAAYPERGPQGRYGADDRAPYPNLAVAAADAFGRTLIGGEDAWFPTLRSRVMAGSEYGRPAMAVMVSVGLVLLALLAGGVLAYRKKTAPTSLLIMLPACMIGYVASRLLAPYLFLPQRFLAYSIPVLVVLAFPVAISAMFAKGSRMASLAVAAATLLVLGVLGGQGGGHNGLSVQVDPNQGIYQQLAKLPPDALIAGWPNEVMDNVPYLVRRRALVTYETHQAFHKKYADEMRARMRALINAYFATSPQALFDLREKFKVDYLVVNLEHLGPKPPKYFAPFGGWAKQTHQRMRQASSEVARQLDHAAIARGAGWAILDLNRIKQ